MSQATLTKHFSVRKRVTHDDQKVKSLDKTILNKGEITQKQIKRSVKTTKLPQTKSAITNSPVVNEISKEKQQSDLKTFLIVKPVKDDNNTCLKETSTLADQYEESTCYVSTTQLKNIAECESNFLTRSPKRVIPILSDEETPSKKKHLDALVSVDTKAESVEKPKESARRKLKLDSISKKTNDNSLGEKPSSDGNLPEIKEGVSRKLQFDVCSSKSRVAQLSQDVLSESLQKSSLQKQRSLDRLEKRNIDKSNLTPRKIMLLNLPSSRASASSPQKNILRTPDKLDALIDQSRSTLVLSPKLDELKKALRLFSEKTATFKECHKSSSNTTPIPSSPKSTQKRSTAAIKYLASSDSLVLPFKYKMLAEMFRNMDALVATLNNRKEKITFSNVKEGVQKIMKKNFSEKHLGQIITIFPTAYDFSREKIRCISKTNNSSDYVLVIVPNFEVSEDDNKKTAFKLMTPACLAIRINGFNHHLLDLVKQHHQDFLKKINFAEVSNADIRQWHPKFPVDSVPDVPAAQLPEIPGANVCTAKDVLNKFKGSSHIKVVKSLQSVADETEKSGIPLDLKEASSLNTVKRELKGISFDLLEKIRLKESAKLLRTMMQSPAEKKRAAMLERVPTIVNILLRYFISESKAALPVESVVDKIIHSLNSLRTPDEIKEHLDLISEKFPDWLKFIQLRKGLYIKIQKETNINEMLAKAGMK